jgi:hypothetical protein
MHISAALIAATLLMLPGPVRAQETKESGSPSIYKIELNIRDGVEGKPHPSLHYTMLVDESRKAVFQAGSRVPIDSDSARCVDVGVNIELTAHASDGKVTLIGEIELTDITGQVNLSAISEPIVGQRKIAFDTTVELGKPALIVDDRAQAIALIGNFTPRGVVAKGSPDQPVRIAAMHQVEAVVTKAN